MTISSRSSCVYLFVRFVRPALCLSSALQVSSCDALVRACPACVIFVRPLGVSDALAISSCFPFFALHSNLLLSHSLLRRCGETVTFFPEAIVLVISPLAKHSAAHVVSQRLRDRSTFHQPKMSRDDVMRTAEILPICDLTMTSPGDVTEIFMCH